MNKVETAVRLRHIPTGLAVKCTQERTQARNRAIALDLLKSKLLVLAEEQQASTVAEIRGEAVKAEWGQQVGAAGALTGAAALAPALSRRAFPSPGEELCNGTLQAGQGSANRGGDQ